jgi:hypothetical protein
LGHDQSKIRCTHGWRNLRLPLFKDLCPGFFSGHDISYVVKSITLSKHSALGGLELGKAVNHLDKKQRLTTKEYLPTNSFSTTPTCNDRQKLYGAITQSLVKAINLVLEL